MKVWGWWEWVGRSTNHTTATASHQKWLYVYMKTMMSWTVFQFWLIWNFIELWHVFSTWLTGRVGLAGFRRPGAEVVRVFLWAPMAEGGLLYIVKVHLFGYPVHFENINIHHHVRSGISQPSRADQASITSYIYKGDFFFPIRALTRRNYPSHCDETWQWGGPYYRKDNDRFKSGAYHVRRLGETNDITLFSSILIGN